MVAADTKKKNNSTMTNVLIALCLALVIIGALNWGASAYMNKEGGKNLVHLALGTKGAADTPAQWNNKELIVYAIVAVAGLISLYALITGRKH